MRVVGFMSEIFRANPDSILEWYRNLQSKAGTVPLPRFEQGENYFEDQEDNAKLLFSQFLWFALDSAEKEQADDVIDKTIDMMTPGAGAVERATARSNMRSVTFLLDLLQTFPHVFSKTSAIQKRLKNTVVARHTTQ